MKKDYVPNQNTKRTIKIYIPFSVSVKYMSFSKQKTLDKYFKSLTQRQVTQLF